MSTKAKVEFNKRRLQLIDKFREKRETIKSEIEKLKKEFEKQVNEEAAEEVYSQVEKLYYKLDSLPRNSNYTRYRRRCALTGRPRGNYRYFGICRIKIIEAARAGELPGILSSSW